MFGNNMSELRRQAEERETEVGLNIWEGVRRMLGSKMTKREIIKIADQQIATLRSRED